MSQAIRRTPTAVVDSKMNQDSEDKIGSSGSCESGDACVDNWEEFCKEEEGELPRFRSLRRRELAAAKLRVLIHKLDHEFDRAILQLGEEDMEGYITAGGEDAWTGFLSTARRLGKKKTDDEAKDNRLTNVTARVQHMERGKEMMSIFKKIVRSHDAQLRGAVLTLSKQQMDRIIRKNHEKFSGVHKQKGQDARNKSSGGATTNNLDHAFATPRVKSAAKSRQTVSLLNQVVREKDNLLKKAIQGMERKEKNLLTSKNNDFLKFEAQRAKQREEFRLSKKTRTVAEHPHATNRVRQEARAKTTLEQLKGTVQKRSKALATSVKRIPKSERDNFVRKVSGFTKDRAACTERALSAPSPRKSRRKKDLDTTRYARAEVMSLSRRVKADVQNAIQVKDNELENLVATMGEEELRVLANVGATGQEEINLWKRDRRKLWWQRLSAFGAIRNDPSLYRKWRQQRHQQVESVAGCRRATSSGNEEVFGATCATGNRRPPWSTDLHYTHRCREQHKELTTTKSKEECGEKQSVKVARKECRSAARLEIPSRKHTFAKPSQNSARGLSSTRPASAPLGSAARAAPRPPNQMETARTPSLARLARVFYQSSVGSTASMPCETLSHMRHGEQIGSIGSQGQTPQASPENVDLKIPSEPVKHDKDPAASTVDSSAEKGDVSHWRGIDRGFCGRENTSHVGSAEERMGNVRLLWAVSQLSADAVTKKIMHGYSERQRAREPNRTRWKTPSRRPRPPSNHCNANITRGRSRRREQSVDRTSVG